MKSLLSSKRSKAILGIGLIAIGIGAISKKVISYPTGGCMKGTQELALNNKINKINKFFIQYLVLKKLSIQNLKLDIKIQNQLNEWYI